MEDRRITSTPRPSSSQLARTSFSTVRRGFDPNEVRQLLETVGRDLHALEQKLSDTLDQLADANRRAANPTYDEQTLITALGQQSAAILRSAHEEAGRVMAEAQERAAGFVAQAQERGGSYLLEAQERATAIVAEAESAGSGIEQRAREGAERLTDSARINGEALVERAREQGRAIVEQSQEARKAVLNDLAIKRKALHVQIDQLRAARDSLTTAVNVVRENVEHLLGGLLTSDEGARTAAIEALRQRPSSPEPTEAELLAGVPLREIPEVEPVVLEVVETLEPVKEKSQARATSSVEDKPAEDALDAVEEIFARLRKATLDERSTPAPANKRPAPTPAASNDVEALFTRRDAAVAEPHANLVRKVKRALQDDQNIMIERLRVVTGMVTTEYEDELIQRSRYVDAAVDSLRAAAEAGASFAMKEGKRKGSISDFAPIDECAADLAVTIVLALRKRISADGAGNGADRANSAYKEWRGARVERLCTDAARRAFHIGITAASRGGAVRYLASPWDTPCDACALDAAAGERPAGENFPSGQPYPPLHAGCGCTILPA